MLLLRSRRSRSCIASLGQRGAVADADRPPAQTGRASLLLMRAML